MRISNIALIVVGLAAFLSTSCATTQVDGGEDASALETVPLRLTDLLGVWDVELYFDPNQPPSTTVMEITSIDDGAFGGIFYGSEFETAQAVLHEGTIVFSAVTSDGTGPYAHGMRMHLRDHIYGQTLSTGRGFVMPWEAIRRASSAE